MQDEFDYSYLERLIATGDHEQAARFCLDALAAGRDPQFWQTQLGYVYFLNETDDESYYNRAPSTFSSLVAIHPNDVNARFWLGYVYDIALSKAEASRQELTEALAVAPSHPYANLVLAGLVEDRKAIRYLRQVLKTQPTNYRALRQLADVLKHMGKEEAYNVLRKMILHKAYIERAYGIMNPYINAVLTGAAHERAWRKEAHTIITADR